MRKSAWVTLGFVLMIAASVAFTHAGDEPRYKNLKVLSKNTNKQQLDSVMRHFTAALGVKCNFCHVFNQEAKSMDFASDANEHKGAARSMMKMMYKLNKKFFDVKGGHYEAKLQVTCYTCHNGKAEPGRWPQMQQGGPGGPGGPPGGAPMQRPMNDSSRRPPDTTRHQQ